MSIRKHSECRRPFMRASADRDEYYCETCGYRTTGARIDQITIDGMRGTESDRRHIQRPK